MEKTFLLDLSAHWGDLIKQIKKICHIHFNDCLILTANLEQLRFPIHAGIGNMYSGRSVK